MKKRDKYGLLVKYAGASLNNLHKETPKDIRKILEKHRSISAKKFYTNRLNFFIASEQRVGKTWALHAIANECIERFEEEGVYYTTSSNLQKGFVNFDDVDSKHGFISVLAGKNVLLIDDLGLEYVKHQSDFVKSKFEDFIRWRVSNQKITYIASKIYGADFIKFYGKSLYDFIRGEYIDMYIEEFENFNIGKIILEEKLSKT
jgi:DNA replication protein DnaC